MYNYKTIWVPINTVTYCSTSYLLKRHPPSLPRHTLYADMCACIAIFDKYDLWNQNTKKNHSSFKCLLYLL